LQAKKTDASARSLSDFNLDQWIKEKALNIEQGEEIQLKASISK